MNVVRQRLQGRDVNHLSDIGQLAAKTGAQKPVNADEEGGQGLSGARGRRDQRVTAARNRGPAQRLSLGGRGKRLFKPFAHYGVKVLERHARKVSIATHPGVK